MKRGRAAGVCLALLALWGAALWLTGRGDKAPAAGPSETAAAEPTVVISPSPSGPDAAAVWAPVATGEAGTVIYAPSPDPDEGGAPPTDGAVWTPVSSGEEGTVVYTRSPTPDGGGARLTAGADYDFSQIIPESEEVEESYFDDALFIGDSRTDGFRLYSGLTGGDYIVKTGLSVFDIETETVKVEGEKMPVPQALARKEYGKVYVCLGLNELGMGDDAGYYDHYAALVDHIRAAQPKATVYLQLLIPVNAQKCAEKGVADYVTNEQIAVYNDLLRTLAQEKRVFLVDPAEVIVDQSGQPPYDAVADGVHFKKEPYQRWLGYLKCHTISKGEWE